MAPRLPLASIPQCLHHLHGGGVAASNIGGDDRMHSGRVERLHEVSIGQLWSCWLLLGGHGFIVAGG